jgi:hypothetical protein
VNREQAEELVGIHAAIVRYGGKRYLLVAGRHDERLAWLTWNDPGEPTVADLDDALRSVGFVRAQRWLSGTDGPATCGLVRIATTPEWAVPPPKKETR